MRSRSHRIAAFIAATGGAIALVGIAAGSTGAYFTDVHPGSVNGGFGKVAISIDGVTVPSGDSTANNVKGEPLEITWNNMLPGQDKTVTYHVTNTGSANESIWLAFDDTNGEWSALNTLGTYGDAQINSPLINADYDNLNNAHPWGSQPAAGHNACGDPNPSNYYLPAENHVADLAPGQSASFTFSFGYGKCLSNNTLQGGPAFANPLVYDIIATQQGISPDDAHNGGVYTPPAAANI
jgi:hypothetical protein